MPGRRSRRVGANRSSNHQPNASHTASESGESVYGEPDPDRPFLCTWCKKERPGVLAAPCGHQFCKGCVEDVVLPISACPIDKRFIRESRLAEFVFLETQETVTDASCDEGAIHALKSRVDSLTIIMDRLIEHLAIRDMVNRTRSSNLTVEVNGSHKVDYGEREPKKGPIISDSEDSECGKHTSGDNQTDNAQENVCRTMDVAMLCNLPSETKVGSGAVTDLVINSDNVRQLLPRFWKKATEENWSDEEKVQRLRMICDPALQRLLDKADVFRKDWAYISSILYGDHVLDEISMIRCLGTSRQRFGETPHQWYLRVCGIVERGLPPGPQQDWEIRSAFIRGLQPRYQQALGTGKLISMGEIMERCSQADIMASDPKSNRNNQSTRDKTCYQCGNRGHLMRNCPQTTGCSDVNRWTPWTQCN